MEIIDWQEILDATYNAIIAINCEGRIVAFNKAAEIIVGYPQSTAIGRKIEEIASYSRLPDVVQTGIGEYNQRMSIGDRVVVSNRSPIKRGAKIIGAVGVLLDISDFEKLSHQLDTVKDIVKDLNAVIESVDDGIVVANGQGYILRVNNAYQKMTGIIDKENVGKHFSKLIAEGYIMRSVTDKVLAEKSIVTLTDVRNGKELLMTGIPVLDEDGHISRVVTAVRDVTELNNLKEQLAKSEKARNLYLHELEILHSTQSFQHITTNNPVMVQKVDLAFHVARVDSTVLILGESGVGKELFAQLIHRASNRSRNPFIKINCGSIPTNLIESELFGYEAGSFTGASKEGKPGLFELAQNGTLFLDEMGDFPLDLQVKILRVLQDREITRVGGKKVISLDVRIVAATNRDLAEMVKNRKFRQDLYYRLNVVPILIPPLRNRIEDIALLSTEFLLCFNKKYGYQKWIHPEVIQLFLRHDWPGNVRELENIIERLVVTSKDDCIGLEDVFGEAWMKEPEGRDSLSYMKEAVEKEEKKLIEETYKQAGSTRKAAQILGISQSSFSKKMKKFKIKAL